ncbi:MAG: DUF222 domain-containing protein [Lapillicoccus sp.]
MSVVATVPALVDGAWQTLVGSTTGASPEDEPSAAERARWAALDASFLDQPVWEPAGAWVEEELKVIEAVERVKAWADAQGLAALRRLHEGVRMVVRANADLVGPHDGPLAYASVVAETTTATVDEVALATGLPEGQVAARLALALDVDQRAAPVATALQAGAVSLDRAERIQQATRDLDPDIARAVAERLLALIPDGSVRSHRSFTRELRRQVLLHSPDPAQTRADALRDRCAYAFLEPDGTGRLTVTGDAARVVAALERVDTLARAFRSAGDSRTLAQLRSDVALDLILYGWADPTTRPADADATAAQTFAGRSPAAHVDLTVALTTLLGLDDRPGELVGHGFVSAAVARAMATAAGSVWRRLVLDPVDGTALELSTGRYRPTPAMAEQVAALDGLCQAPGCTVPASRCDVDHAVPWPQGATAVPNLHARHRRHHNHKTRQTWTAEPLPDGSTDWLTVSRRRYTSHRRSHDDPLTQPAGEAELARADRERPPPF